MNPQKAKMIIKFVLLLQIHLTTAMLLLSGLSYLITTGARCSVSPTFAATTPHCQCLLSLPQKLSSMTFKLQCPCETYGELIIK